ncbi:Uncharacterised protein [Klebsiella variicola]|nr:Uncharacterised protein [Klebsiella variicola]
MPGGAAHAGPAASVLQAGSGAAATRHKAAPCPVALRLPGLLLRFCRPGQAPAATRRNNSATGNVSARAALSRATTPVLFPGRLRSQYFFCVMSLMAQGAHRGRPVAAAPCTPGLRPATSPLRGAFDLSLQASGRAEAASGQNTALSPHPCGLPRPSGNVSAMLRPPAPAVSAASGPAVIWDRRPGQAQPPPGNNMPAM